MLDDVIISSDKISDFTAFETNKSQIYETLGSPSIQISDIDDVWIYLISLQERYVFEENELTYQTILRFTFDSDGVLTNKAVLTKDNYNNIVFSKDKTKVRRDAYGITDQLYDAFTRGQ